MPLTIRRRHAFTLVELMTVVLIFTVLLAIAMPNFMHARQAAQAHSCLKNLQTIDQAVDCWALDNQVANGGGVTMPVLTPYFRTTPICPTNGVYSVTNVGVSPTCSVGGTAGTWNAHTLP